MSQVISFSASMGLFHMPRNTPLVRGLSDFWSTTASMPLRPAYMAAPAPAQPAPMMSTSVSTTSAMESSAMGSGGTDQLHGAPCAAAASAWVLGDSTLSPAGFGSAAQPASMLKAAAPPTSAPPFRNDLLEQFSMANLLGFLSFGSLFASPSCLLPAQTIGPTRPRRIIRKENCLIPEV